MTTAYEIFISCGDPSGDLHASNLARAIKKLNPEVKISSVGGQRLQEKSDNFIHNLVDLNVHGFWEPVKNYFNLRRVLNDKIIPYFKNVKPDLFIPVDYYGFNIIISKEAKKQAIPVHYYISPQIWATRTARIKKIREFVEHIYVIFPFEEKIYREAGIPATFVGHPFLDSIPVVKGQDSDKKILGIFPGSRTSVIKWNLPNMLKAVEIVRSRMPGTRFVIIGLEALKECYGNTGGIEVAYESNYEARKNFTLALCTSGTVTLENALLGLPMIVTYKLPWLMYYLIKSMILVDTVTIVNLICGEQVVPELIQGDADPKRIADMIVKWLSDKSILEEKKRKFIDMRNRLGEPGSYERTAEMILKRVTGK